MKPKFYWLCLIIQEIWIVVIQTQLYLSVPRKIILQYNIKEADHKVPFQKYLIHAL